MREVIGIILLLAIFAVIGFGVGWCALEVRTEQQQEDLKYQRWQIQAKLNALRSANRLHVAFWRAKEEMDAEARLHHQGGGR